MTIKNDEKTTTERDTSDLVQRVPAVMLTSIVIPWCKDRLLLFLLDVELPPTGTAPTREDDQ